MGNCIQQLASIAGELYRGHTASGSLRSDTDGIFDRLGIGASMTDNHNPVDTQQQRAAIFNIIDESFDLPE